MTAPETKCRHRLRKWGGVGYSRLRHVIDKCSKCGAEVKRKPTAREKKDFRADYLDRGKLFTLTREFERKFIKTTKKKVRVPKNLRWLYPKKKFYWEYKTSVVKRGYDLMLVADRFAKKYPDRVFVAHVDDDHFSTSRILFITQETTREYMGAIAWYIPQNAAQLDPTQFFLYPCDVASLMGALRQIQKREKLRHNGKRRS